MEACWPFGVVLRTHATALPVAAATGPSQSPKAGPSRRRSRWRIRVFRVQPEPDLLHPPSEPCEHMFSLAARLAVHDRVVGSEALRGVGFQEEMPPSTLRRMNKSLLAAMLGTVLLIGLQSTASAASFGVKCETYRYNAGGNPPTIYRTAIYQRRVSCKKAEAIVKDFQAMGHDVVVHRGADLNSTHWTLKRYPGWRCVIGAGGGACVHRSQTAQYVLLSLPTVSGASLRTRSCGPTPPPGFTVAARATPNVSCAQARRILKKVYGENSSQCFSKAGQFHPCRLEGFHCTMRSKRRTDISSAQCTKGRNRLILGRT